MKQSDSIGTQSANIARGGGYIEKIKFVDTFFNNILADKCIKVMGFEEKDSYGIKINNKYSLTPLYAVELVSSGSTTTYLNSEDIGALSRVGGQNNYLVWVLVKSGMSQKNYILSYNLKLINMVAAKFGLKLKSNIEMLNVLYDINMGNNFFINKGTNGFDRALDLSVDLSYKFIHDGFNKIISNKVLDNLEEFDLYQAIGYSDLKNTVKETNRFDGEGKRIYESKKCDISSLFRLDFQGAVYTYINFSADNAKAILYKKVKENRLVDGLASNQLKIYLDGIKDTSVVPVSMNTVLLLKRTGDRFSSNNSVYTEIGNSMGCIFEKYTPSSFYRKGILRFTPVINRNELFTEVFDKSAVYDYISCVHKDLSPNAQMFGTDHNGAFTNYNLKYITADISTTREHFFVGGETGSSKTTFINAMKSQMIKFDWDSYKIGDMNGFKFREFDIKKSLRPFADFVKKHNEREVSILETDLNKFSYNLINCNFNEDGTLNKSDVSFCVQTTSFILEARDKSLSVGLDFSEKSEYEQLIEEVYVGGKHEHITIGSLADYQKDLANELYELGYKPTTSIGNIKEERYAYLRKPTLESIIKLLDKKYSNKDIQNDETKYSVVKSLRSKLEAIFKLGSYINEHGKRIPGYYSRYEAFDLDSKKKWVLFDMDTIKGNESDYGPIQWILLNRMIRQDMKDQLALRAKGLPEPKIIYFMEEAHNVFDSEMFKKNDFFGKAAREWRSYNIILGVISQKSRHIPKEVYEAIETKFFLFAGADAIKKNNGEGKTVQIYGSKDEAGIRDLLGLNDSQVELMFNTPMYTACAVTDSGTFTIKLHTTDKMRAIFDNKLFEAA